MISIRPVGEHIYARQGQERRGEAFARLGLVKSRARQGAQCAEVDAELTGLRARFSRDGLHHAVDMFDAARQDLGLA